jgi:dTMP kinase
MVTDPEVPRIPPAAQQPVRRPLRTRRLRTIALVGIDGSGKTTQAHRLAGDLAAAGLPATYRRNAGGRRWFGRLATLLGRRDAEHLLGRRGILFVESVLRWLAIARTLLRRAVTGEVAVMDRYAVCQYASLRSHAAVLRPTERTLAERFARFAYGIFPAPDVTFVLAVDPAIAYDRIETRGYDHESMEYLTAATAAYRALPEYATFVVIDANLTPDEVTAAIAAYLATWLPAVSSGVPAPAAASPMAVAPVGAAAPVAASSGLRFARWSVLAPPIQRPFQLRRNRKTAVPELAAALDLPDPAAALDAPATALLAPPLPAPPLPAAPLPAPRAASVAAEHTKAIVLAAGPLAAGATAAGHRFTEAVQTLT